MSQTSFNFLFYKVKGIQSFKKRLKQFTYFESKLKPDFERR